MNLLDFILSLVIMTSTQADFFQVRFQKMTAAGHRVRHFYTVM